MLHGTNAYMLCVPPTLNTAVRVAFMARHVPSQAGNETSEAFDTLLYGCYLSIAKRGCPPPGGGEGGVSSNITRAVGACIGGENWGVLLVENCPHTKAKAPLRKVGHEPTGSAALPATQMESVPASV